jgi:hypothetical protein
MKGTDYPLPGQAGKMILDEGPLLSSRTIVVPVALAIRSIAQVLGKVLEGRPFHNPQAAQPKRPPTQGVAHQALRTDQAELRRPLLQGKAAKTLNKQGDLQS